MALGDDHTGDSSTTCHQSDMAVIDALFDRTIGDGGQIVVTGLAPGTYTSTETVPAGWDLDMEQTSSHMRHPVHLS